MTEKTGLEKDIFYTESWNKDLKERESKKVGYTCNLKKFHAFIQ